MIERCDSDIGLAVHYALQLANHRGKPAVTPEDLLVGLTWRVHDHDCQFGGLKGDADRLWAGVGVTHLPITASPYSNAPLHLDERSSRVIRYMRVEANSAGQYWIDIDHLLLALLRENGLAAKSLRDAGWSEERIKAAGSYGRARYPQRPIPWKSRLLLPWERYGRWIALTLAASLFVAVIIYLHSQN